MPVPQRVNFLVEQASCLFLKSLLRMVQHLSSIKLHKCPEYYDPARAQGKNKMQCDRVY
ncbi:hypothetical protein QUA00_02480 [Microcoleus sp. T2B6]|uniref:hypothetical protein n=1 Tax=unclassified Microcoleus TaxID=2642155 RepID=UPI002FD3D708